MKYALLIYVDEAIYTAMTPEEQGANMAAYNAFGETHDKKFAGGEALQPIATATTVRVREGRTVTIDGPFAETKEQLAGFYVVNCANLDEAIAIAAQIPDARTGSIEIRPVLTFE